MMRLTLKLLLVSGLFDIAWAQAQCACDPARPETLKVRECSLCAEAEKQPAGVEFFVLKDVNPRKPNRWLVLPRVHDEGQHPLDRVPKKTRDKLWAFAIRAAQEKFGDAWGLAYNGYKARTQCHLHFHLGKFIQAAENSRFKVVRRVEDLPAPDDTGIWIHPVKGGFHVHTGEQIMETALMR